MRFIICLAVFLMAAGHAAYAVEKPTDGLPPVPAVWYEGGTLQKATVGEWRQATAENQLASSADFVASLSNVPDIGAVTNAQEQADIKKRAMDLQACVNKSISESDLPQDKAVAELVVMCTIMKKSDSGSGSDE